MYQLIRTLTVQQLLIRQAPVLLLSIAIAELFYKFHSFTLETAAFLATWFVLDAIVDRLGRLLGRRQGLNTHEGVRRQ